MRNPFGVEGYPWMPGVRDALNLLLSLCMLASALSLVMRYRRSGGEVREQIKWIAFAASLVALGVTGAVVLGTFTPDAAGDTHPLWVGLLEDAITHFHSVWGRVVEDIPTFCRELIAALAEQ